MKKIMVLMRFAKGFGWALTVAMMLLSLGLITESAQARPLDLTLQPSPDMFSDAIEVNYDAASQMFTARGFAEHIKNGTDTPTQVINGQFEITAAISNSGDILSGTLTITGEVPSLGIGQGQLLVGNISALGYGEAGGAVEFQFDTSDGAMFTQFGPAIKVILGQSGFTGNFAQNFNNGAIGVAGIGW
ncbi:hypothetical protein [Pelotalea chapellei]|uniref:Uncharacterized protein n=1 Tax=Pelotalea chapellei TaxID=44671 RepID=A0ABS5U6V8_9BACT|nr:hypothetical protein [Pelotalea chapellei]MBT1071389.1 hypothetical protein [Pelotalea chapellei]